MRQRFPRSHARRIRERNRGYRQAEIVSRDKAPSRPPRQAVGTGIGRTDRRIALPGERSLAVEINDVGVRDPRCYIFCVACCFAK
jgi:hypothetical protein